MNPREKGFLLLTAYLGNPERKPLTTAQFRDLTRRMQLMEKPNDTREVCPEDLIAVGCSAEAAQRVVQLLSETELLENYLRKAKKAGCVPITRVSDSYPLQIRRRLGLEAPGVLWAKGDISLLQKPAVALVGSRELASQNRVFAMQLGVQAARQGFVLVSGNARGADRTAQDSCLSGGGRVICVVADELQRHTPGDRILYLSEDGYDLRFSAYRALKRNAVIHALASRTFVARCRLGKGGTWDGTVTNLKRGYSPVFCCDDGSPAADELEQMGAKLIRDKDLEDISSLQADTISFMDR